jgi:hypothetical protein
MFDDKKENNNNNNKIKKTKQNKTKKKTKKKQKKPGACKSKININGRKLSAILLDVCILRYEIYAHVLHHSIMM